MALAPRLEAATEGPVAPAQAPGPVVEARVKHPPQPATVTWRPAGVGDDLRVKWLDDDG